MITKFGGMNISSKNPEALARFYNEKLGIPICGEDPTDFDGAEIGFDINQPHIWIWNENEWGKSNTGTVTFVFECDDHDRTYEELKTKGVELDPPTTASWGGKELIVKDPDGNTILIL
ncbi:MAG: VOC family protein [Oscillospiraceae bacterium]|nr:VOC family protein [Oscillospiraceae bacterium]